MEPQFVDIQGAAALLGVPRKKVAGLVRDGVLEAAPSVLDKRRKLIRRADLEALLAREGRTLVLPDEGRTDDVEPPADETRKRRRRPPNEDEAKELLKRTLGRVRRKGKNSPA